mmetsp:Transcript_5300/g.11512  ORF Transcript_5300/g.11512 Transcript_5300/m.11512 type:complete len:248 (+) Transcript_5300:61-804(+)
MSTARALRSHADDPAFVAAMTPDDLCTWTGPPSMESSHTRGREGSSSPMKASFTAKWSCCPLTRTRTRESLCRVHAPRPSCATSWIAAAAVTEVAEAAEVLMMSVLVAVEAVVVVEALVVVAAAVLVVVAVVSSVAMLLSSPSVVVDCEPTVGLVAYSSPLEAREPSEKLACAVVLSSCEVDRGGSAALHKAPVERRGSVFTPSSGTFSCRIEMARSTVPSPPAATTNLAPRRSDGLASRALRCSTS